MQISGTGCKVLAQDAKFWHRMQSWNSGCKVQITQRQVFALCQNPGCKVFIYTCPVFLFFQNLGCKVWAYLARVVNYSNHVLVWFPLELEPKCFCCKVSLPDTSSAREQVRVTECQWIFARKRTNGLWLEWGSVLHVRSRFRKPT